MQTDMGLSWLGGLSPAQFVRRHWQRKPLLIRQAFPGIRPPVSQADLFRLAGTDGVESRLLQSGGRTGWRLGHGPFTRRQIPPLSRPQWTLLVQGVDLHVDAARELLSHFRFVPEARLDDLMISLASDGGGVGPHYDSYDVFLLQVQGRRRWRIGPLRDDTLLPGLPVKILANFEATEEHVLEPGDMLYLPPRHAHDGVAVGDGCMTCSIGFRAPNRREMAQELLARLSDVAADEIDDRLYRDPPGSATVSPGRVPDELVSFARQAIVRLAGDPHTLQAVLGEWLTEPKPTVWFDELPLAPVIEPGSGWKLDRRSRMMYDDRCVYLNGESYRAAGVDARCMRQLADERYLAPALAAKLSTPARELMVDWCERGWIHPSQLV